MDVSALRNDPSPKVAKEQKPLAILFFEKERCSAEPAIQELRNADFLVSAAVVSDLPGARQKLSSHSWDIVAAEFYPGNGATAFDLLAQRNAMGLDVPVILLTAGSGEEDAAECIRRGASHYLLKANLHRFPAIVEEALGDRSARREQAQLEWQLQQSQKMESIGRLTGAVAHDFNNLLEIIVGYSELLLQDISRESPFWKSADEIKKAGMRAASLTRQLLAFSRRQVLAPRLLKVNEAIGNMSRSLRRTIGDPCELATTLDPNLWSVKADASQIEQIVLSLTQYACESLHGHRRITIETANVERTPSSHPDAHSDDEHAEVSTGPHVMIAIGACDPESEGREPIFEPFVCQKRGTRGLELAIVYEVVRQCNGHIWVQSESGQGTVFKIYLPRELDYPPPPVELDAEPVPGTETLVLAEDESATRELIARVLASSGYRVLEAANGRDALGFFEQPAQHVDLLITDLVMPVMGGGELARKATALSPGTRVLYISGYSDDASVRQGVLEGAAYLQKPFPLDILNCKVRELLDRPLAKMA